MLSAIVAFALLAQSLGLAAPCMCDVEAAAATAAAGAVATAAESTPHACCAGHGGAEAAAASSQAATSSRAARRTGAASLSQRCAEGCSCDASLSAATVASREGWAAHAEVGSDAVVAFVTLPTPTPLILAEVARWVGPPGPDVGPATTARRLARLQRWRC